MGTSHYKLLYEGVPKQSAHTNVLKSDLYFMYSYELGTYLTRVGTMVRGCTGISLLYA